MLYETASVQPGEVVRRAHVDVEILHKSGRKRIDPAVHADRLSARPGVLHEHVGGDVADLADDVQLAQAVKAGGFLRDRLELMPMLMADLADRVQPVVDQAAPPA